MEIRITGIKKSEQDLYTELSRRSNLMVERNSSSKISDPNLFDFIITLSGLPALNNFIKLLIELIKLKQINNVIVYKNSINKFRIDEDMTTEEINGIVEEVKKTNFKDGD